jgi:hypothetical protein
MNVIEHPGFFDAKMAIDSRSPESMNTGETASLYESLGSFVIE